MRFVKEFADMNKSLIAAGAMILGLSALPVMADSMETQTFDVTGTTTSLGLLPFDTSLGTLDSVSVSVMLGGQLTDGDSTTETFVLPILEGGITQGCGDVGGCSFTASFSLNDDSNPSALLAVKTAFTQTFTVTGTVTNPSASGTLTYDYTPAAVPEPASWGLLLTLIGMCLMVRKRSTQGR